MDGFKPIHKIGGICDREYHGLQGASRWFCEIYCDKVVIVGLIFKRFYRSRFSQDTQGIGLGLPLAKAVVEAHHGTIEVDSELGKGTTFTLNFPIPTKL